MKTKKYLKLFFLSHIVALIFSSQLYADVTVERFTKISGIGGVGANESTSITKIKGLKKREKVDIKFTGSLGKYVTKMGGPMETDSITDIERGAIWSLNHEKKTYTETKISEIIKGAKESQEEKKAEKSDIKIVRNEFSVKETGEKKNINGYDCRKYILTWLVEIENVKTKEHSKMTMTDEIWTTPETKELKEYQMAESQFGKEFMKKIGMEMSPEQAQQFGFGMIGGMIGADEETMRENMKKLSKELSKIKGVTIASNVKWVKESDTQKKQAEAKKTEVEEEETEESEGVDVSQGVSGFLGGIAKKAVEKKMKEEKKKKEAEEKEKNKGKENLVFEAYTEIKRVSVSKIDDGEFSVPPGYKLVK